MNVDKNIQTNNIKTGIKDFKRVSTTTDTAYNVTNGKDILTKVLSTLFTSGSCEELTEQ